jgi:flagellar hook protein FlgE
MIGRICCLHFSIERVKCVGKDGTDAGHGRQKPVEDDGSIKGQFVNG